MNRFIKRANKRVSLGSAAALLAAAGLTGAVLGILRTKFISQNFDTFYTDAFFAAFKIPDFMFFTLASGALGVAFLPILADHLAEDHREKAWELTYSLLNLLAIVTFVASLIVFIFAPQLLRYIVAPSFSPEKLHEATIIMRLVAFNPFVFCISTVIASVQQAFGRFFFYAIAPLFYNTVIILSVFMLRGMWGIHGVGVGVMVGSLLQLGVVCLGLLGMDFRYRAKILWQNRGFKHVLRALPARSIDQGIDYINSIAETRFGSRLGTGAVTHYENALTLHNAPINLIGIAISTAAFPHFTERISQGRPDLFRKEFLQVLRAMIWIAAPVVVVSYFARGYLARMIFGRGAPEIATIFGFLVAAIFFRTMYTIVSRYFYAQKDTRTPLAVSLFVIAMNIGLAGYLSRPESYGVAGLALAQSIVATTEVVILGSIMLFRDHKLFNKYFWGGVMKIISVTGFSALTAWVMVGFFPLSSGDKAIALVIKLTLIASCTILMHVGISWLFGLAEVGPILAKGRQIILKPIRIQ